MLVFSRILLPYSSQRADFSKAAKFVT